MGVELKRIVGDNTKAGDIIQKQIVDLDVVFNELIKQIVQKIVQVRYYRNVYDAVNTAWMKFRKIYGKTFWILY